MLRPKNISKSIRKDKIVISFCRDLRNRFGKRINKIILFGSRARGSADVYSDYDFLILCDRLTPGLRRGINELEDRILVDNCRVVSSFSVSQKDFSRRRYEPYLMNADKEGILLYE